MAYEITERNGWSYVVGPGVPADSGPWRYAWEAQEYADELSRGMITQDAPFRPAVSNVERPV